MSRTNSMTEIIYRNRIILIPLFFVSLILISNYSFSDEKLNIVNNINYVKKSRYSTIVIYLSDSIVYKMGEVPAHEDNSMPYRVYIDFKNTELGQQIPHVLDINDSIVKRIRSAQFDFDTARVVVDLSNDQNKFEVLSFNDPNRIELSFFDNIYSHSQEDSKSDDKDKNHLEQE